MTYANQHCPYPRQRLTSTIRATVGSMLGGLFLAGFAPALVAEHQRAIAITPPPADEVVECEILIIGGGLAGTAAAYESLQAGRTVCITELTDWLGGQITSQGTSALDEAQRQRSLLFYSEGYNDLRSRIEEEYDELNPGDCWVSASCFLPPDAKEILMDQLEDAADEGDGTLKWFPSTVVKDLELSEDGRFIEAVTAIQHQPAPGAPPLNTEPLSQIIEDAYQYEDSDRLTKTIIRFEPPESRSEGGSGAGVPTDWYVIEATETGEIIGLADIPYRLGLDPRTYLNPSSASETGDPYCTQGFTYTFAMEQTEEPVEHELPPFYSQYEPYYGYDPNPNLADFDVVFTYRRLWAPDDEDRPNIARFGVAEPRPGDISMQNWTWGNDYRPGTIQDNLIYSREQLAERGELEPGGWMGGLRTETLRAGEEHALGFFYWLVVGTTDSQQPERGDDLMKVPHPNHRLLTGLDSPMGTEHGLSKYPYIREGRRIIGRPSYGYESGFAVNELDISRQDYRTDFYRDRLSPEIYTRLWKALAGLEATSAIRTGVDPENISRRTRSTIYPDSVGIAQYAIDFHPCMAGSPAESPGNIERPGSRQAQGQTYPAQIPLRSLIPQQIDNLLVAGKSIATSHIAAAAYRVHSFEWSVGAAAGTTADFALEQGILPYELVDDLPRQEPQLEILQRRLVNNGNPIAFPNTSIFNEDWEDWRVWGG
ncbi:MAG: FAD-dependent oxidoreductase [Synechococcales bacterium]|nr:FAD-dependent oxidoreductase [Synechococcales bacterium]